MDSYMEKRLLGLHYAGSSANLKQRACIFLTACLAAILLPTLHICGYYYAWSADKAQINRQSCACDCFDTVFRGRYEWPPSAYKHFYFNATLETAKIWSITVLAVLLLYESIRYLSRLHFQGNLHKGWLAVFATAIYPHYYGWWNFVNYYNEEFFVQWWHQLFFTVTEVMSTLLVLHLCNKRNPVEPWKLLFILTLNLMHVIIGSLDQFVVNLLQGHAQAFEAVRDLGLLAPDLFHVLICGFELQNLAEKRGSRVISLFYKEEIMLALVVLILFSLLGKNL